MLRHRLLKVSGIGRVPRTGLCIGRHVLLKTLQARFILHVHLQNPRGIVFFGNRIGQCGLDGVTQLRHELRSPRFGTGRGQCEQGAHTDAVLQ